MAKGSSNEIVKQTSGGVARRARFLGGLAAIALVAAACGSASSTSTTTAAPGGGGSTTTAASGPTVKTVSDVSLGTILVDSQGFTLYRLNKDSMNKSVCTPACAKIWPPLLVTGSGSPVGGSGVTGLGTIKVAAGEQVTYKGMPLYTFTGDSSAGQTHGQNVTDNWGTWFVVVTKAPAGGGVTTTTAAGGTGVGF